MWIILSGYAHYAYCVCEFSAPNMQITVLDMPLNCPQYANYPRWFIMDYLFISASYSVIREFSKAMHDITTVIVRYMTVITLYASSERICKLSPRIFSWYARVITRYAPPQRYATYRLLKSFDTLLMTAW